MWGLYKILLFLHSDLHTAFGSVSKEHEFGPQIAVSSLCYLIMISSISDLAGVRMLAVETLLYVNNRFSLMCATVTGRCFCGSLAMER